MAPPRDLHVTSLEHIDHGRLGCVFGVVLPRLLRHKRPQALNVDGGSNLARLDEVKVAHAHLSKVARVILVEIDAVVVLATRVTATTWMFAVLANAAAAS